MRRGARGKPRAARMAPSRDWRFPKPLDRRIF